MNKGEYDIEGVIWHQHSNYLMIEIMKHFEKKTPVLDIGCGHNWYVSVLNFVGYKAIGCDMVDLDSKKFFVQDVTEPILARLFPHKKINVLSLEVGEHIPAHLAFGYFNNLTKFGGDIIMSWAVPGQAGVGHINCQPAEWVCDKMGLRGYTLDTKKTKQLRESVAHCHCAWFRNTLMYFTKSTK